MAGCGSIECILKSKNFYGNFHIFHFLVGLHLFEKYVVHCQLQFVPNLQFESIKAQESKRSLEGFLSALLCLQRVQVPKLKLIGLNGRVCLVFSRPLSYPSLLKTPCSRGRNGGWPMAAPGQSFIDVIGSILSWLLTNQKYKS